MQEIERRAATQRDQLAERYREVRRATDRLAEPLHPEDCVVQSMPDVSPTKWHLAHVTWFFETFVLKAELADYRPAHPEFEYLFNSYYNTVGAQYPRPRRGLLTRPTLDQVREYRARVDLEMTRVLERSAELSDRLAATIEIGLHHEQQHQELLLMDIKHVLSCNPTYPAYRERATWPRDTSASPLEWIGFDAGLREIGHSGAGFCYDNEGPRHPVHVPAFELGSRLVTNGEYLRFIEAGNYERPDPWLADGWTSVRNERWEAPLYWVRRDDGWHEFTLAGLRPLDPNAPLFHVSYFEADAFASWSGARLPTEAEWETAAENQPIAGNLLDEGLLHTRPATGGDPAPGLVQLYGDVWEWTSSSYSPYPGFRAPEGALGEYNGKFMCNQYVLRGGSCATWRSHLRATYRNFFYPHCRWQFSGIRLARDI